MESSENKYKHLVGTVIDERYEVLSVKGIGGMAVVLKARDKVKNRIVAIKMLNEKHINDSVSVRRFVNESRAIALLSNEQIVDIYDVAFTGKSKYIVMEYIDGITLREYMRRNGPLGFAAGLFAVGQKRSRGRGAGAAAERRKVEVLRCRSCSNSTDHTSNRSN